MKRALLTLAASLPLAFLAGVWHGTADHPNRGRHRPSRRTIRSLLEDIVTSQAEFDAHVSTSLAQLTAAVDAVVAKVDEVSAPAPALDFTAFDSAVAEQVSRLTVVAGTPAPPVEQPEPEQPADPSPVVPDGEPVPVPDVEQPAPLA